MKKLIALTTLVFLAHFLAFSQGYNIQRANNDIVIDGYFDEADWENAEIADNFFQYFPADSIPSILRTEVKITYNDNFIYFAAKVYDKTPNHEYVTPSLRRDYRGEANDGITIVVDPFQDQTNAFQFGVNPYGVQREGLIANGGNTGGDLALEWDNKWYSTAKRFEGYWTAEIAIPFKTLRYKEGAERWNINFYRIDSETGERSSWTRIPRNFRIISLAFMQSLVWDKPLPKAGANVSLIPFLAGIAQRDFENPAEQKANYSNQIGGDAKIAVSSGLNLDITVNPDFSQVEVDQQVTNLDRFEIFFPERRQFFLENADLFSSFGHPLARPFFSRRIGVARDASTGQNIQNRIPFGLRLSGKLDNNWRVGLLNMQAAADESIDVASTNHTVAVVQRKVFGRSNIGAILVNKQITEDENGDLTLNSGIFNRVAGVDYNLSSLNGKWAGKLFYHRSFSPENLDGQYSQGMWLDYQSPGLRFNYAHVFVGENFQAQDGFVPRRGIYRTNPEIGYFFYPKSDLINNHGVTTDVELFWNKEFLTDSRHTVSYRFNLQNTSRFSLNYTRTYTYLLRPFDPTNTGGVQLAADDDFSYTNLGFEYQSDFRRKLGVSLQGNTGTYFNGNRNNIAGEVTYRIQPYGSIGFIFNYNNIKLPEPYASADLVLFGPRFDITMTRSLFFTSFFQYNSQINNININARLQWRFKPVSDFFLVYTDNYGTMDTNAMPNDTRLLIPKNRALVFKMTYWLNL